MECFVVGVVATGFIVRAIVKSTQSWDRLSTNLGFRKIKPFRLEGRHHGLDVVIEQIPGPNKGSKTTEIRIKTAQGWPAELIIHSLAPRRGLMQHIPSGIVQKVDSAIFALRFVVLNVPLSGELCNRILGLPKSELFLATHDEFRFVFTNKSFPSPMEIRKLLFQLHTIMKKVKMAQRSSIPDSASTTNNKSSFVDVDYKGLLNTITQQPAESLRTSTSNILYEQNETDLDSIPDDDSYDEQDFEDDFDEVEDNRMEYDSKHTSDFIPAPISDPTNEEERSLVDFYRKLCKFGMTSHARKSLITNFTISALHVEVAEIRPTFELTIPEKYRKGITVFGVSAGVPVYIYIQEQKKLFWKEVVKGEEFNLLVHMFGYDVLRRRLVFLEQ